MRRCMLNAFPSNSTTSMCTVSGRHGSGRNRGDAPARPRGACAVCGEVHLAFRTLADMESFKASVPALKNARLKF